MKILTCLSAVFLLGAIHSGWAQDFQTDTLAKSEVSKLHFLIGDWAGEGWMMDREGQKHTFEQTERIQFKLDSTAVLIEGLGRSDGRVIHNAMAVVTYDDESGDYAFQSFLQNGRKGEFDAELIDGQFHWYPNDNSRYVIWIDEQGRWVEKGEYRRGEGPWSQFFEMTLDRR